jgi:hypothetical protein
MRDRPSPEPTSAEAIALGHEPTAISLAAIMWFLVIFVVSVAVIGVLVWWLMLGFEGFEQRQDIVQSPLATTSPAPPQPWLQPSKAQGETPLQPWQEMEALRSREQKILDSYGVGDGTVQIPVRRAMEIIAQRGLPTTQPREAR